MSEQNNNSESGAQPTPAPTFPSEIVLKTSGGGYRLMAWIGWAAAANRSRPEANAPLRVYDSAGRLIRRLEVPAFGGSVHWDARDQTGALVQAGVYFLRIDGGRRATAKMTVVR